MAKEGEINYLKLIGEEGRNHSVNKPFSDPLCGRYLMEIGAVIFLLPKPPAKLLDFGCGTGWTSIFFAKCGYDVIGQDISEDAIALARKSAGGIPNIKFEVCDYENTPYNGIFDCAVFFDSLHHAVDEESAIRSAYSALRKGGICVTSEPGICHQSSRNALEAVKKYNVTEKSMPPDKIRKIAKKIGFSSAVIYPHANMVGEKLYGKDLTGPFGWLYRITFFRNLYVASYVLFLKKFSGLVVLIK